MLVIEHVVNGLISDKRYELSNVNELDCWYESVEGFRLNYVVSAKTNEQTSSVISNSTDRAVLGRIRNSADLIITTGLTAVSENLTASKYAPMLILTNRQNLDVPAVTEQSEQRVFVTSDREIWPNRNAISVGKIEVDLTDFLENFCEKYRAVVLETGISTTKTLSNLLTEVCLTVTDAQNQELAFEAAQSFLGNFDRRFQLQHILEIEETWFFRFKAA
ncbi:MAG: hypothetical protein EBZ61_02020 [Micrococcales bacterium]|nr:hypothetical protein [Micrococcales bacterium]